ncbi:hypothetical protein Pelo_4481 [Pelomyxa schiedti]|nr:hypothetical protein Pelo_4481 [Pelomyxa schiedti]
MAEWLWVLQVVSGSYVGFFGLYFVSWIVAPRLMRRQYERVEDEKKQEWHQNSVSFVHSFLVTQGSLRGVVWRLMQVEVWDASHLSTVVVCGSSEEYIHNYAFWLFVSCGYFLYDMTLYHTFSKNGTFFKHLHHIIPSLAIFWFYYMDVSVPVVSAFNSNEISTPFLELMWFFRYTNHSALGMAATVMFVLSFVVSRVIGDTILLCLTPWVVWDTAICSTGDDIHPLPHRTHVIVTVHVLMVAYCLLQYVMMGQVTLYIIKFFTKRKETKEA